jgi:hypothetical protein
MMEVVVKKRQEQSITWTIEATEWQTTNNSNPKNKTKQSRSSNENGTMNTARPHCMHDQG